MNCHEYFSLSGWKGSFRDFLPSQLADASIAVSKQALSEARRYFRLRLPATVIPNAVEAEYFSPVTKITDTPRLIFIGRGTDRVKNVGRLLEACQKIHLTHQNLEVWFAPGLGLHDLKKYPFVKNLGPLTGQSLSDKLRESRALILCSLYEGDGIVLREAQAMGIPVIASNLPAIRDNVAGYENSILIDPYSVESISAGIEKMLFSKNISQPKPRIRDWSQAAKEFETFYRKFIS